MKVISAFIWPKKLSRLLSLPNSAAKVFRCRRSAASCGFCSAKWDAIGRRSFFESRLHLLTDGKSIYLEDQQDRIIDLLKNARQPMFLVCVSDQVKRLDEMPKKGPAANQRAARKARSRIIPNRPLNAFTH